MHARARQTLESIRSERRRSERDARSAHFVLCVAHTAPLIRIRSRYESKMRQQRPTEDAKMPSAAPAERARGRSRTRRGPQATSSALETRNRIVASREPPPERIGAGGRLSISPHLRNRERPAFAYAVRQQISAIPPCQRIYTISLEQRTQQRKGKNVSAQQ